MAEPPDPADWTFDGFDGPGYTQTPNRVFDDLLKPGRLTEAELRVLLYIIRHTFGWGKDRDPISLSQLVGGVVRRDGTRLDWGAGVARSSAVRATQGLEAKGIITIERSQSTERGRETSIYGLHMRGGPAVHDATRVVAPRYQGSPTTDVALVAPRDPQKNVTTESIQKTDRDRTDNARNARGLARTFVVQARTRFGWRRAPALEEQIVEHGMRLDPAAFAALLDRVGRSGGTLDEVMAALEGE